MEIVEAEAARLPDMLKDADYAVINSNYAINAGLNPVEGLPGHRGLLLRLCQHPGCEGGQ